jgi:hypothetical protein
MAVVDDPVYGAMLGAWRAWTRLADEAPGIAAPLGPDAEDDR